MLLSRIQEVTSDNTPESIFASSLTSLFPDSNVSSHGDAGHLIAYASPRFGNVELQVPHRPTEEEGRQLFAHYLWNSAAVVASKVEEATCDTSSTTDETAGWWDVKDSRVLELGAGTALPSLIAALAGASAVCITDHPSSPALTTRTIQANVSRNLYASAEDGYQKRKRGVEASIDVTGYLWGSIPGPGRQPLQGSFDKIILADCLWMPSQHGNLVWSILHFLAPQEQQDVAKHPCALVIAAYHTGRETVSNFFEIATAPVHGLQIAKIYELDVHDGRTRMYVKERPEEDKVESKRWCVVAVLKRGDHLVPKDHDKPRLRDSRQTG